MKQRRISAALVLLAVGAMATRPVLGEDDPHPNKFTLHNAIVAGTGASHDPPVTILLDRKTGQTWMLGQGKDAVQWVQIPYSPVIPQNAVPPSSEFRKDFQAIFHQVDRRLVSFMGIEKAELNTPEQAVQSISGGDVRARKLDG